MQYYPDNYNPHELSNEFDKRKKKFVPFSIKRFPNFNHLTTAIVSWVNLCRDFFNYVIPDVWHRAVMKNLILSELVENDSTKKIS